MLAGQERLLFIASLRATHPPYVPAFVMAPRAPTSFAFPVLGCAAGLLAQATPYQQYLPRSGCAEGATAHLHDIFLNPFAPSHKAAADRMQPEIFRMVLRYALGLEPKLTARACGAAFAVGSAALMARAGYRATAIKALFGAASCFADSKRAASPPPPASVAAARSLHEPHHVPVVESVSAIWMRRQDVQTEQLLHLVFWHELVSHSLFDALGRH